MNPTDVFISRIRTQTNEVVRQSRELLRVTAPLLIMHRPSPALAPGNRQNNAPQEPRKEKTSPHAGMRQRRVSRALRARTSSRRAGTP